MPPAEPVPAPRRRLNNRELSWLDFNARVLEEAQDPTVPVLERVKFLAIFSSNLDEFFMVRVAGIWRQIEGSVTSPGPDGLAPREVFAAVTQRVHALVAEQHRSFLAMLPELAQCGVRLVRGEELDEADLTFVDAYFDRDVLPLLTPVAIDPGHPFPYLSNRSICLIAEMDPLEESEIPQARQCVIHIPAAGLPRFLRLPSPAGQWRFLLLEDLIRLHLGRLFKGYRIRSCTAIRVTRDAELDVTDEQADDLLSTIEDAVRNRRMGSAVRLQHERGIAPGLLEVLVRELELDQRDLYPTDGPTGLTDLIQVYNQVDAPALRDPEHTPRPVEAFAQAEDVFAAIRASDILAHHPYDDFDSSVVRFIREAAADPDVVAIKMTLYRVGAESPIAHALAQAARAGKQVAVLVELRARFSEEGNIVWARRLEATGAHVVYGIDGLKTHCKAALVVRREGGRIRRYCHLGTGNYNAQTARLYTDVSLFTCAEETGEALTHLFNFLTGYVRPPPSDALILAPSQLRDWLVRRIRQESENARAGRPAGITAKLNSLVDPRLIEELYAASDAGVPVDLLIRGICCLRPGVPGLSENIRVARLVDRFLEHARIVRFETGGAPEWWLSSADWMPRNLGGRIEVAFPVRDPALQARVQEILDVQRADTVKARWLDGDGGSHRPPPGNPPLRSQVVLARALR